jgi:hypothetical protein
LSPLRARATETNDCPVFVLIHTLSRAGGAGGGTAGRRRGGAPWHPRAACRSGRDTPWAAVVPRRGVAAPRRGGWFASGRGAGRVRRCGCAYTASWAWRWPLVGIVIGGTGKITRRWSRNDPVGSCGGVGPRRSLVARGSRIRSAMEVGAVREGLDLRVHDTVALDEIELYAEVLSAVAATDRPLTSEELDEVLGVRSVA